MIATTRDGTRLHMQVQGPPDGPAVVFANGLGTTLAIWDGVVDRLPGTLRVIRYDMRGHGRSDVPEGPYAMGTLISDAEAVIAAADARDVTLVGLSIGGMVAQGLAVKRLDLIGRLVLSNTATKISTPDIWRDRAHAVLARGLASIAEASLERWFGPDWRNDRAAPEIRAMLIACDPIGYAGGCAAISGTDFYATTATLRLPTLGIAGSEDGSTPPDLMRETLDLIPGSRLVVMRGAGHLACVQDPAAYAGHLNDFLAATGQI